MNTTTPTVLATLRSSIGRALQWRLWLLFAAASLLCALIAALPAWNWLAELLNHSVQADAIAEGKAPTLLLDALLARNAPTGILGESVSIAAILMLLLSPLLAGATVAAARSRAHPGFGDLLRGAIGEYGPMLRMLVWSIVQLGFVFGTAIAALLNLADVVPSRGFFAVSAVLGALANAMLVHTHGFATALVLRFITGLSLAGVYPPAMKMASTWFRARRGFAIGTVVGALTVGKATPYLVHALPNAGPNAVILVASACAVVAAILVVGVITIVYTYLGGMKAVIWTDLIQFVIKIAGAVLAFVFILRLLPNGWDQFLAGGEAAGKFRLIDAEWNPSVAFNLWAGVIGGCALTPSMIESIHQPTAPSVVLEMSSAVRKRSCVAWPMADVGKVTVVVMNPWLSPVHAGRPPIGLSVASEMVLP